MSGSVIPFRARQAQARELADQRRRVEQLARGIADAAELAEQLAELVAELHRRALDDRDALVLTDPVERLLTLLHTDVATTERIAVQLRYRYRDARREPR